MSETPETELRKSADAHCTPASGNTTPEEGVLSAGVVIEERYEIVCHLGTGGMGSVYKARHLEFERDAAIKILHPKYTADLGAVKRFQREARIISTLNHPHILSVYAFGGYLGFIYLAMEYAEGSSLGRLIFEEGPLRPAQAIPLLLQICEAMSHAHKNETLHRDLKPDNVMVVKAPDGTRCAKVVDFGLAKLLDGSDGGRLTKTGEVVGDPRYMSPEQCRGEPLDARSDIYSFGCLMYEVFTGRAPFQGNDPVEIMYAQISKNVEPFARKYELPQALEAIALNSMAKDRNERYDSFDEVFDLLKKVSANPEIKIATTATPQRISKQMTPSQAGVLVGLLAVGAAAAIAISLDPPTIPARLQWQFAKSPQDQITAALSMASYYQTQKDKEQALIWLQRANKLAVENKDGVAIVRSFIGIGDMLSATQPRPAHEAYSKALVEAEHVIEQGNTDATIYETIRSTLKNYLETDPRASVIAHQLAARYMNYKMYDKARGLLETVPDKAPVAERSTTQLVLGKLSLHTGDRADARKHLSKSVEIAAQAHYKIPALQLAGSAATEYKDFKMALAFYQQALSEADKTDLKLVATLRRDIAESYLGLGDLNSARVNYGESVAAAKRLSAPQPTVLAKSLHGLGDMEYHRANYAAAERVYREEIALRTAHLQSDPGGIAAALCMLGDAQTMQGNPLLAADAFEEAMEIMHKIPPSPDMTELRSRIEQKYASTSRLRRGTGSPR